MPLNKLENFIKNTEGRILYVNPNDLDATDGVENQGNSLTKPFKTIQRALLESARFSYLRGNDNDIVEKTTILVFPGEHLIDNRPGYAIKDNGGVATTVSPGGAETFAGNELTLTLNTNFDLTQEDNILYKFNSINGGIIIPRGTSIVGLDLRKTKVRPKYVPNPTDPNVPGSAIFRVTGACYFWQFTFFDGNDSGLVYTDPSDFSINNQSKPTFSHHKLTCFEYADGVTIPSGYALTDLDMYYSKISNAFNRASGREIDQKYPAQAGSFAKQRPEWEIVGAFASDPVPITSIISGDGATPGTVVTVTTQEPHGLTSGTPIKIRGINVNDYNISTKVVQVISETVFTYALSFVRANLPAGPAAGLAPGASASVTIETDTVSGASPYIFNVSLRSVYGMQGMHADGSKSDGFRSMVVAQFTAVSLQKDDRAFVKYNPSNRTYDGISISRVSGEALASESASTNQAFVYHLDSDAIYRNGWKTTHIKMSNDAVIQIVSVFAIGFNKHFEALSGGDASITNSNSNFGQTSLAADGFKAEAFSKDDKGYITSIVTPRAIVADEANIEWVQFDVTKTNSVAINNHLYLLGYTSEDIPPPVISQGYRIGSKVGDSVYVDNNDAQILMTTGPITSVITSASGTESSAKVRNAIITNNSLGTVYTLINGHTLRNGESIRVFSETGDLPEGLEENKLYYAITSEKKSSLASNQIQIASSRTNAEAQNPRFITSYGGTELRIESRVSDKEAGELGHPIQWDPNQGQWFVHTNANSNLYQYFQSLVANIANTQLTLTPTDGETHTIGSTAYPVMGRLYVPTGLVTNTIDVLVVFHGTIDEGGTQTIAEAAETSLNFFLDQNNLNVRDKIIFSAAYPQDHISQSRQYGLTGVGTEESTFLFGDNLPYARAAVGWVQNSLDAYMAANGISKTIGNVYLFGHSQGGALVSKINTLDTGITGVIANAPGPIQFDQTCNIQPGSTSCTKIAAIHGASTGNGSQPYESIGIESYTSTHNAPLLFTQALDDTAGGGNQATWLQDYVNAIDAIGANAATTLTTVATGGHAAFTTDATLQAAIRNFLNSNSNSQVSDIEISYVLRKEDGRSLDEKLYKMRYVIPKELVNGRDPVSGFILQDSSSTNVRQTSDFTLNTIDATDYDFERNPRFITTCSYNVGINTITIRADKNHDLKIGDKVIVENVTSSSNPTGTKNLGFNGTFTVDSIIDDKTFSYENRDVFGVAHDPGTFTGDINVRNNELPRFTRNDVQENYYIYRVEVITPYIYGVQDGVYYLYVLNSGNAIPIEFTDTKYSQKVTDLYPQQDRDNYNDNPPAASTFTKRFPLGDVVTNDLKRSITRESVDKFFDTFSHGIKIQSVSDSVTSAVLGLEKEHQLAGIRQYTTLNGGSGHTDGTYYNVRIFNNNAAPSSAVWDGATATVTVSSGAVTSATITEPGSGYTDGEQLYFDSSVIGGTPQANIVINSAGISTAVDNYVQVTGIGTTAGGYFRITNTDNKSALGIAKTSGDATIVAGQYVVNLGPAVTISQTAYNATTKIATYSSHNLPHGLLAGNAIRILDNSNNNLGDYIVNNVSTVNSFTVKTSKSLSTSRWVLKHGMSANNASADDLGENLGIRGLGIYANEILTLGQAITSEETFQVELPGVGIGTLARFPLGSYIQIDNEIMRITTSTLSGTNTNEISVIRGSMGTIIEPHSNGSLIKKIKLTPVEFRRPSILRASGHTFEYLGYGPGNYSTGLPQVQVKTLTEKEEFLSQAQETACGTVLYTGMDSDGDFYIGNTKYSSQSGEQTTFDVPTPTITGEDPNRLSVVFDEVIVKERILVEGGNSGQILSQFDGPVTFNGAVRINEQLVLNNNLRVTGTIDFRNENDAVSCTDSNAALRVAGGVAIGKRLFVCSDIDTNGGLDVVGISTLRGAVAAQSTLRVTGISRFDNTMNVYGNIHVRDNYKLSLGTGSDLQIYHDGTNSYIDDAGDGLLNIRSNGPGINIKGTASKNSIRAIADGAVELYYNDSLKLATTSTGGNLYENWNVGGNLSVASNTVTITSNSVTATTFNGRATNSAKLDVSDTGNAGWYYPLLTKRTQGNEGAGTGMDITRDIGLRFNANINQLEVSGDIIAYYSSDERLKDNVSRIDDPLAKVISISGNTFDWREESGHEGSDTGVIAQEVEALGLPGLVVTRENGYKAVRYEKLVPLLIEAIKELSDKVSALEDRINK